MSTQQNGVDLSQAPTRDFWTDEPATPLEQSIFNLLVGSAWGVGQGQGLTLTVSYSVVGVSSFTYGQGFEWPGVSNLTAAQIEGARWAMSAWSAVSGLVFVEVSDTGATAGDIRWTQTLSPLVATAHAYLPSQHPAGGDVWIGPAFPEHHGQPVPGNYGAQTYLHELGHALGLGHPHEGMVEPVSGTDALKYSVMSYFDHAGQPFFGYQSSAFPQGPMLHDIAAIQWLYGANMAHATGNNVYHWSAEEVVFETIWDAGGIDTLDASGQAQGVRLDLRSGQWSEIGVGYWNAQAQVRDTLTIAYGTVIENALGSAHADTLLGNDVSNLLNGGDGHDSLFGGSGNDTLIGGGGNDTLDGGPGADRLEGGDGLDTASYAGAGAAVLVEVWKGRANQDGHGGVDTLVSIEHAVGSAFNDTLVGDTGANRLEGGSGHDSLRGGSGNDTLIGGSGNDTLDGGPGADRLEGGDGLDTASYAGAGAAVLVEVWKGRANQDGHGGVDTLVSIEHVVGSAFNDTLVGDTGANRLEGGAGHDSLRGGSGNDTLIGGGGNDTLDGGPGADRLEGGDGLDTASYAGAGAAVLVEVWKGRANQDGHGGVDTLVSIEHAVGSAFNDTLVGDTGANRLEGGAGHDSLRGGSGNDTLIGGSGNDTLDGGPGNDRFEGGAGHDLLLLGTGADLVVVGHASGQDSLHGFSAAEGDRLQLTVNLNGSGLVGAADAWSALQATAGGTLLQLGGGHQLLLVGVDLGDLSADIFWMV